MDKRAYSLAVGVILIIVSIAFFVIPYFLKLDAFFPFMFALVSFILGIGFFFMGLNEK
jgi:hypothetical protein